MSDERYRDGNETAGTGSNWSLTSDYALAPTPGKREFFDRTLSFTRALLFSPGNEASSGSITVDRAEHIPCPVCKVSLHKSAKYCSSCGVSVNRDMSYENSW